MYYIKFRKWEAAEDGLHKPLFFQSQDYKEWEKEWDFGPFSLFIGRRK